MWWRRQICSLPLDRRNLPILQCMYRLCIVDVRVAMVRQSILADAESSCVYPSKPALNACRHTRLWPRGGQLSDSLALHSSEKAPLAHQLCMNAVGRQRAQDHCGRNGQIEPALPNSQCSTVTHRGGNAATCVAPPNAAAAKRRRKGLDVEREAEREGEPTGAGWVRPRFPRCPTMPGCRSRLSMRQR